MEDNCFSLVLFDVYSLLEKGFKSDSVWHQIRAVSGGTWSYRPSFQLHVPRESKEHLHHYLIDFLYRKTLLRNNLLTLLLAVSQIQNLGYFPVKDLQLNIEIPEMTKNGNHFLHISDFYIDRVSVGPQS